MNYFLEEARNFLPELKAHRRQLHANAEVGFGLEKTLEYVRGELRKIGLSPADCGRAGLVASVGSGSPCILLRADMDALPIPEESGEEFACETGAMHACGHDLHTAMLLVAAKMLKAREAHLDGTVKLMFQPAEETFEGALDMIGAGVLENPKPDAAVMIHVTAGSPMPTGMIVTMAPGVSAPAADYFTVRVQGKGCHGSTPQLGVDALTAAAHILIALQAIHARELAPQAEAVLTVGTLSGGTVPNAIADSAELKGTIRTYDEEVRGFLKRRMEEIVTSVARTFRAEATLEFTSGAPTLQNDAVLSREVPGWLREMMPQGMVLAAAELPGNTRGGGSEDFAYVSQRLPTLMLALAAGEPDKGYGYPLHHPKVRLDENAMPCGVAALVHIAMRYLQEHK